MHFDIPGGDVQWLFADMLKQPHSLIAGATGSGKSVVIHGLLCSIIRCTPYHVVLIDPKKVELWPYRTVPHCIRYAADPGEIYNALRDLCGLMDERFTRLRYYNASCVGQNEHIYIIIDELADMLTGPNKKYYTPFLSRLTQLGRAAGLHVVAATQRPTRDVIAGQIAVNIDARLALRCPTAQDSRNIIHTNGAETLPRFGYGYYLTPETYPAELIEIPFTGPQERYNTIHMYDAQMQAQQQKQAVPAWRRGLKALLH